jgi:hypothetical protein
MPEPGAESADGAGPVAFHESVFATGPVSISGTATALLFKTHPAASAESSTRNPVHDAEEHDPLSPIHDPEAEIDLCPNVGQRFDDPTPTQLEVRGVTAQTPERAFACRQPAFQSEFWSSQTVCKNSVAAKLRIAGMTDFALKLEWCHSEWTIAHCNACGKERHFPNRCDLFCCPECTPRLSHERAESVEWWSSRITEPKFVTLTVRNIGDLTSGHIREFKSWFTKLRRRKFAHGWRGGFYTIEVTNEGRGWHLHLHALVDAQWIDGGKLAIEWASVTGGAGHIVKVKDARAADYLRRVKTYIVKGSTLASWTANQIATYVQAFDGVRTFGVFGSLYGARTEFSEWIKSIHEAKPLCPCGSSDIHYMSESEALMRDLVQCQHAPNPPPATPVTATVEMFQNHFNEQNSIAAQRA